MNTATDEVFEIRDWLKSRKLSDEEINGLIEMAKTQNTTIEQFVRKIITN